MHQPDDMLFSHLPPQHLSHDTARIHIQHRKQQGISVLAMDVHVLDVHAELFHGFNGLLHPPSDELPLAALSLDYRPTQQLVFFHKPVGLFVIDDHALLPESVGDFIVTVTNKLLCQDEADGYDHTVVTDAVAILHQGMGRRLAAPFA